MAVLVLWVDLVGLEPTTSAMRARCSPCAELQAQIRPGRGGYLVVRWGRRQVPQAAVLALPVAVVAICFISRRATEGTPHGPQPIELNDPVLRLGTGAALRSMAAEPSRPASHRCVLGFDHERWRCGSATWPARPVSLDYSVAVKERSTSRVLGGKRLLNDAFGRIARGIRRDPETPRAEAGRQARVALAAIAMQLWERARVHRLTFLSSRCHG